MTAEYQYPYPPAGLEATYPFVEYQAPQFSETEMLARAQEFYAEVDQRRSVRMFSDAPVPRELIELAVKAASTAPSGAHKQPWTFVATQDPVVKAAIRAAAEEEERVNYLDNRMNEEWQEALGPLGTDHHKEFLEIAPWIVVLFEQRFEQRADGSKGK
ncbi:MAG: nitroreductase family protein, partial [Actinobacteria bacterium]|nr:nitroreductase family protein [Actinomycetota bacterium]